jgi:hypothetical protein
MRRRITLFRRLSEGLRIPAEILVRDYPIERAA